MTGLASIGRGPDLIVLLPTDGHAPPRILACKERRERRRKNKCSGGGLFGGDESIWPHSSGVTPCIWLRVLPTLQSTQHSAVVYYVISEDMDVSSRCLPRPRGPESSTVVKVAKSACFGHLGTTGRAARLLVPGLPTLVTAQNSSSSRRTGTAENLNRTDRCQKVDSQTPSPVPDLAHE